MALMDVNVLPVGTASPALSEYVARAVRVARESGLAVTLTASGTEVSGPVDKLLAVAARMHEAVFDASIGRVITTIRIDDRRDVEMSAEEKVRAVEEKLAKRR
jgi:uncharacterized protein (TIGR00106 family)